MPIVQKCFQIWKDLLSLCESDLKTKKDIDALIMNFNYWYKKMTNLEQSEYHLLVHITMTAIEEPKESES